MSHRHINSNNDTVTNVPCHLKRDGGVELIDSDLIYFKIVLLSCTINSLQSVNFYYSLAIKVKNCNG